MPHFHGESILGVTSVKDADVDHASHVCVSNTIRPNAAASNVQRMINTVHTKQT